MPSSEVSALEHNFENFFICMSDEYFLFLLYFQRGHRGVVTSISAEENKICLLFERRSAQGAQIMPLFRDLVRFIVQEDYL